MYLTLNSCKNMGKRALWSELKVSRVQRIICPLFRATSNIFKSPYVYEAEARSLCFGLSAIEFMAAKLGWLSNALIFLMKRSKSFAYRVFCIDCCIQLPLRPVSCVERKMRGKMELFVYISLFFSNLLKSRKPRQKLKQSWSVQNKRTPAKKIT